MAPPPELMDELDSVSARSSSASCPTSPSTSSAPPSSASRGSASSATPSSSAATAPSTGPLPSFGHLSITGFNSTTLMPDFPHPVSDGRRTLPVDCRHGRVLLYRLLDKSADYLVWDPVTGDRHSMPEPYILCLMETAAVLCAADSCDHFDCHGGPFRVVLVDSYGNGKLFASVYSSEMPRRGTLIGDEIYFTVWQDKAIVKYDLGKNCLSMIEPPSLDMSCISLMAMENSSLGIARIQGSSLYTWSRKVNPEGAAEWVQCKVIDLETMVPVANHSDKLVVVGFAEGVRVIFVSSSVGLFTVKLNSRQVKRIDKYGVCFSVLPYMSLYTPDCCRWRGISCVPQSGDKLQI